jgi:uncharacterized protein (TIGR00288 family)
MAEIKKERVAIFIDGSNFYHGLKACIGNTKVDFEKFAQLLCGSERELIRTYYYNAPVNQEALPETYKDQQRFFDSLKTVPYFEVKLGRLEKRTIKANKQELIETFGEKTAKEILDKWGETIITYVEKGVDIELATDMLRLAYNNAYDTGIIVTGDGDFVPAIKGVKDMGKHVENANFSDGKGYHIRTACDKFIPLDKDFLKPCLKKQ